jgi:hypothetical protein
VADIQIISDAGRDARRRRVVKCRCACGVEFVARLDNVKAGHTKRCPNCKGGHLPEAIPAPPEFAPPAAPATAAAPVEAPIEQEHNEAWYRAEIASATAALQTFDKQESDLMLLLTEEGVKPAQFDEKSAAQLYREIVQTATITRKEKKRLEGELRLLETLKAKPTRDPMQSILDRAAKLRGKS